MTEDEIRADAQLIVDSYLGLPGSQGKERTRAVSEAIGRLLVGFIVDVHKLANPPIENINGGFPGAVDRDTFGDEGFGAWIDRKTNEPPDRAGATRVKIMLAGFETTPKTAFASDVDWTLHEPARFGEIVKFALPVAK